MYLPRAVSPTGGKRDARARQAQFQKPINKEPSNDGSRKQHPLQIYLEIPTTNLSSSTCTPLLVAPGQPTTLASLTSPIPVEFLLRSPLKSRRRSRPQRPKPGPRLRSWRGSPGSKRRSGSLRRRPRRDRNSSGSKVESRRCSNVRHQWTRMTG